MARSRRGAGPAIVCGAAALAAPWQGDAAAWAADEPAAEQPLATAACSPRDCWDGVNERWVPFLGASLGYTPARFSGDDLLPGESLGWTHGSELSGSLGAHYLLQDARIAAFLRGHADVYRYADVHSQVRLYGLQLGAAYWWVPRCSWPELGIGAAAGYAWAGHTASEIEAAGVTIDGWSAQLELGLRFRLGSRVTLGLGATLGVVRLSRPGAEAAGAVIPHADAWVLRSVIGPQLEVRFPSGR